MKWLLIYVVSVGAGLAGGTTSDHVPFENQAACERVLADMNKEANRTSAGFWGNCYPNQ